MTTPKDEVSHWDLAIITCWSCGENTYELPTYEKCRMFCSLECAGQYGEAEFEKRLIDNGKMEQLREKGIVN